REGRFAEAEPLLRQACEALLATQNAESPQALNCEIELATNLTGQGRNREAQILLQRVIARRGEAANADPATLRAKLQLARTLRDEGTLGPAETMLHQVVEARRISLGERNNLTLSAITELASVLAAEHREVEAEPLYRLVLKDRSELLGPTHPDTLSVTD